MLSQKTSHHPLVGLRGLWEARAAARPTNSAAVVNDTGIGNQRVCVR